MRIFFEFLTGLWFGFSFFVAIFIYSCYDGEGKDGWFFVFDDHVYWVGTLGEIDYE